MKRYFLMLVASPVLSIALLCALGLFSLNIHRRLTADLAPPIPQYDWSHHPNTVLICYNRDCGCGASPSDWVNVTSRFPIDTLVVANRKIVSAAKLPNASPQNRLWTFYDMDQGTLDQLTPAKKPYVYIVQNGRIVDRIHYVSDVFQELSRYNMIGDIHAHQAH